ncbi:MAG TPA: hypothetical protein VIF08_02420, partial [Candidatus Limnocylindrales bacterium]
AKVAQSGWGAQLLARQESDGVWRWSGWDPESGEWGGSPPWITLLSLGLLKSLAPDPADPTVAAAMARLVAGGFRSSMPDFFAWAGRGFFEGETEACINGRVVGIGAYFRQDVHAVVERLLGEQMADGGWNCELENGSTRGSFHSTVCVLEGLLEYERSGLARHATDDARRRGEEYLLERHLLRRLSTGEEVSEHFGRFGFPYAYRFNVLRGLDYLRAAGAPRDPRMDEALQLIRERRGSDGKWLLENSHEEEWVLDMGEAEGEPSRWVTLHALRVLRHFSALPGIS